MLTITIPESEAFDERTGKFYTFKAHTLKMEHSLLSLQKWESKHHKYYIGNKTLTDEEIIDYIKFMTINQVEDYVFDFLTEENLKEIIAYIEDPMTATWFSDRNVNSDNKQNHKEEIITSEVIYASMIYLGIPVDLFEKRHLNHLLTLIRVCKEQQNPEQGKMSTNDLARYYSDLNKKRRAKLGTKG